MPTTFSELLADQLRSSGARPVVTFYDDASGERVELSALTYGNWVAKTAGLLQDELGLERGAVLQVDLPTHWLAPVWLGAAWSLGLVVTDAPGAGAPDAVVTGPDQLERYAGSGPAVVAVSLLPMAARFAAPLPVGVLDYGVAVWGQPDAFTAYDPPEADDPAWASSETALTQRAVLQEAGTGRFSAPGTRLLTALRPHSRAGLAAFLGPLGAGGGTVWVRDPDPGRWAHKAEVERATVVLDP